MTIPQSIVDSLAELAEVLDLGQISPVVARLAANILTTDTNEPGLLQSIHTELVWAGGPLATQATLHAVLCIVGRVAADPRMPAERQLSHDGVRGQAAALRSAARQLAAANGGREGDRQSEADEPPPAQVSQGAFDVLTVLARSKVLMTVAEIGGELMRNGRPLCDKTIRKHVQHFKTMGWAHRPLDSAGTGITDAGRQIVKTSRPE